MPNFTLRFNRRITALTIVALSVIALFIGAFGHNRVVSALPLQPNEVERTFEISKGEWPTEFLKVEEVINLQSEEFPKGFGIKIKNISKKPIYFLHFEVTLPESKPYVGGEGGAFRLEYGDRKFSGMELRRHAEPTDTALQPGESCVLSLSEDDVKRFFNWVSRRNEFLANGTTRLTLVLQLINFGDGTGYGAGRNYTEY